MPTLFCVYGVMDEALHVLTIGRLVNSSGTVLAVHHIPRFKSPVLSFLHYQVSIFWKSIDIDSTYCPTCIWLLSAAVALNMSQPMPVLLAKPSLPSLPDPQGFMCLKLVIQTDGLKILGWGRVLPCMPLWHWCRPSLVCSLPSIEKKKNTVFFFPAYCKYIYSLCNIFHSFHLFSKLEMAYLYEPLNMGTSKY